MGQPKDWDFGDSVQSGVDLPVGREESVFSSTFTACLVSFGTYLALSWVQDKLHAERWLPNWLIYIISMAVMVCVTFYMRGHIGFDRGLAMMLFYALSMFCMTNKKKGEK